MSINEQVKELREIAENFNEWEYNRFYDAISRAADTIESLSAKLQTENTERSTACCNGGWIPCSERLPEEYGSYLVTYFTSEIENEKCVSVFVFDDMQKKFPTAKGINIIAWQPLPEPYKPQ